MDRYRGAVIDRRHGPELRKAISKVSKGGYSIGGQHYKRVPRGYDQDHQNTAFLLHNGLTAHCEMGIPDVFFSSKIVQFAFNHFKKMSPIHFWLCEALG
jgi:hypothetical protein